MAIQELLTMMVDNGSQDLHLTAGSPPAFRINGQLKIIHSLPALSPEYLGEAVEHLLDGRQKEAFRAERELDFIISDPKLGRFRGNAAMDRGHVSLVFRRIANLDLDMDKLGLPAVCRDLALKPQGLIVVAGQPGSGKSTTLAAMIEYINTHFSRRVITLEDPIEYIFENKQSFITQRQIGEDARSFPEALSHLSRQGPDVIMIGECRDATTMAAALAACESGYLVMTTSAARSAAQTVARIIDSFPPQQHEHIRAQLAMALEAVIYQELVPRLGRDGGALVAEVMLGANAVRNLIREGKTNQLPNAIHLGASQGMLPFDQGLLDLLRRGIIHEETALSHCRNREQLERDIRGSLPNLKTATSSGNTAESKMTWGPPSIHPNATGGGEYGLKV